MKKIIVLLLILPFVLSCDGGRVNYNNPNIPNYPVNLQIYLNNPTAYNLQFASGHMVDYSQGVRGIVIFNTGSGFLAYDLACPNVTYSSCTSPMQVNSLDVKCTCDNSLYSLYTGLAPGKQYPMKPYRVEVNGSYLLITN
jgi:nitrite reductase/ring-hydroxylating ferredoxin subunit